MSKSTIKKPAKKVTTNARARERKPRIVHSDGIVARILDRVAGGEPLSKVCGSPDMPTRKSFFEWVEKDPDILAAYKLAIEMRADLYAEETIQIADDGQNDTYIDDEGNIKVDHDVIARSRLRVDARKWYASKLAPKKYGDKVETTHTGPDGGPVKIERIERVIVDPKK